jgi:hypothetical protein
MSGPVFIVASGPSLTREDCWSITGRTVYAVNNAYMLMPHGFEPRSLYGCDEEWWDEYEPDTRHIQRRVTCNEAAAKKYDLEWIRGQHTEQAGCTFDASGTGIVYGGNGGFQALNLAYVDGHRDVVLLGFDMGHDRGEPSHYHGEHPHHLRRASPYADWRDHFRKAAPEIEAAGMRVRNATRRTFLDCFEKVRLEDALRL